MCVKIVEMLMSIGAPVQVSHKSEKWDKKSTLRNLFCNFSPNLKEKE